MTLATMRRFVGSSPDLYIRPLSYPTTLDVWMVDGRYIRDNIDIDFTCGAQALEQKYIPYQEIWVDAPSPGGDEQPFWVKRLLRERRLMSGGVPYEEARQEAKDLEADLRQAARGDAPPRSYHVKVLGKRGDFKVWLVDGYQVRNWLFIDFTQGGHPFVYDWLPKGEIWIDDALVEAEYLPTLQHEFVEAQHMRKGMKYNEAHALACQEELLIRQRQGG